MCSDWVLKVARAYTTAIWHTLLLQSSQTGRLSGIAAIGLRAEVARSASRVRLAGERPRPRDQSLRKILCPAAVRTYRANERRRASAPAPRPPPPPAIPAGACYLMIDDRHFSDIAGSSTTIRSPRGRNPHRPWPSRYWNSSSCCKRPPGLLPFRTPHTPDCRPNVRLFRRTP